jgi:fibronectin type 3 domain-containing protein
MPRFATSTAFFLALLLLAGLAACDSSSEDTTPPAAPSELGGTSEAGAVALEWSAPSDAAIDGYNVYRSKNSFSSTGDAQRLNGSNTVSESDFRDDEVENGTTYYYRVAAVDETGNESDLSPGVEKTPFGEPPSRP